MLRARYLRGRRGHRRAHRHRRGGGRPAHQPHARHARGGGGNRGGYGSVKDTIPYKNQNETHFILKITYICSVILSPLFYETSQGGQYGAKNFKQESLLTP